MSRSVQQVMFAHPPPNGGWSVDQVSKYFLLGIE